MGEVRGVFFRWLVFAVREKRRLDFFLESLPRFLMVGFRFGWFEGFGVSPDS